MGVGNDSFLSTEFEEGDKEYRVPKFSIPKKITEIYIRFWVFKKVFILSSKDGIKLMTKEKNKFKILFGISGNNI